MSFVIYKEQNGQKLYWRYGTPTGWTKDKLAARQYAQEVSAKQALVRISKRADGQGIKIERINI